MKTDRKTYCEYCGRLGIHIVTRPPERVGVPIYRMALHVDKSGVNCSGSGTGATKAATYLTKGSK